MSKITLSSVGTLIDATTARTTINTNFDTIEEVIDNTLSRDGTSPNQMEAELDMNSNRLINLPEADSDTEPVRKGEFDAIIAAITGTEDSFTGEWDSVAVSGGTLTYAEAYQRMIVSRSNGNASNVTMVETLPGTSPGFLSPGWETVIANDDSSGLLAIIPGTGATLDGSATGWVVLGPGQRARILSYDNIGHYKVMEAPTRARLANNTMTQIYVNGSIGSDNNHGITSAAPFATIQKALDITYEKYDLAHRPFKIKVADGTYGPVSKRGRATGQAGASTAAGVGTFISFTIEGNTTTPANCIVTSALTSAFSFAAGVAIHLDGFKVTTSAGVGVNATHPDSSIALHRMDYGACSAGHLVGSYGCVFEIEGNVDITGSAPNHINLDGASQLITPFASLTTTLTGSPTFSDSFIRANTASYANVGDMTYTGSATGTRWAEAYGGRIIAGGRALNSVFPGTINGRSIDIYPMIFPQGRITATSATPVLTTTVSGATSIFYTPYTGAAVPVFDSVTGRVIAYDIVGELTQTLADATKSPAAAAANKNYDMFLWLDSGTLRCTRGPAWTSDTSRGTGAGTAEIARNAFSGLYLNVNSITNGPSASNPGVYVGTIRTNGAGTVDFIYGGAAAGGTAGSFGVWNMYNRVVVNSVVSDSNTNWSVAANTKQALDASNTNRISYVSGLAEEPFRADYTGMTKPGAAGFSGAGIGYDSITVASSINYLSGDATNAEGAAASFVVTSLGFHFFQAMDLNSGANAATNYGTGGLTGYLQGGLLFSGKM